MLPRSLVLNAQLRARFSEELPASSQMLITHAQPRASETLVARIGVVMGREVFQKTLAPAMRAGPFQPSSPGGCTLEISLGHIAVCQPSVDYNVSKTELPTTGICI